MAKGGTVSQAAFARMLDVSKQRVTRILADRILPDRFLAEGPAGVTMIVDPEAAAAWYRNTVLENRRPRTGPGGSDELDDIPDLAESRQRREAAEAALAELKLAELQGDLLPAADVERQLVEVFSRCKTKLLGVPARFRQRVAGIAPAHMALLEELVREALEDLAGAAGPEAKPRKAKRKKSAAEATA